MQKSQYNDFGKYFIWRHNLVLCFVSKNKWEFFFSDAITNQTQCTTTHWENVTLKRECLNVGAWIQSRQTKLAHISCFLSIEEEEKENRIL